MDIDFRIVTVATDAASMWPLEKSAAKYGITVDNLGEGSEWNDDMKSFAGMPKIDAMRSFLKDLPDQTIVLFMDGYDTIFTDNPALCIERFWQIGSDIVFGAERALWPLATPEQTNQWPRTGTPYRYLNSGLYIVKAWALRAFFDLEAEDDLGDDQLFCQHRYLICNKEESPKVSVSLDAEAYIFQNHEADVQMLGGQLWNPITNCCGVIYHGNGGVEAKERFLDVASWFGINYSEKVSAPAVLSLDYEEVAQDILVCDFLSEVQCQNLIRLCEDAGGWGELSGDKFPAQEIRIKRLGLFAEYEKLWSEHLGKIAEKHWHPMEHIGLRDAFAMRYSSDTQTSLGLHTDASLVTGSVKLNDEYDGAELVFPRQYFDNSSVDVGKCILFPSQVTHGHFVPDLKSGIKYSLTMWTSRYAGDVN